MADGFFFRGYIYLIKWINYMFIEQLSVYNYQFTVFCLQLSIYKSRPHVFHLLHRSLFSPHKNNNALFSLHCTD